MKESLEKIISAMNVNCFTIEEKAEFLLKHNVYPVVKCYQCVYRDEEHIGKYIHCKLNGISVYPYHFCKDGIKL